jgi:SAM-dependent methyltransferase
MKIEVGHIGHKLEIQDDWKILDVGGGDRPCPRANVVADPCIEEEYDSVYRHYYSGIYKCSPDDRFVKAGAEDLSIFKDKEFDLVISCYCLHYVDYPGRACEELMRVARRGYFEHKSLVGDLIHPPPQDVARKWHVIVRDGKLTFIFRSPLHFGTYGVFTLNDSNKHLAVSQFWWEDTFSYSVIHEQPKEW